MITVSTTHPAEAREIIGLMRQAPAGLGYKVYLLGTEVAVRPPGAAADIVIDTGRWPAPETA